MECGYDVQAKMFKALADEKRLQILEHLRDGEKCACVLADLVDIKQSALSYHMKILGEAGIVKSQQDGRWIYFSIDGSGCGCIKEHLDILLKPNEVQTSNDVYLQNLDNTSA